MPDAVERLFGDLTEDDYYPGSKRRRSDPPPPPPPAAEAPPWDKRPKTVAKYPGVEFFTIGDLARALNRQPVTIRSWEAKGLMPPAKYRKKDRRLYTRRQVEGLMEICERFGVLKFHVRPDRIPQGFSQAIVKLWKEPLASGSNGA